MLLLLLLLFLTRTQIIKQPIRMYEVGL